MLHSFPICSCLKLSNLHFMLYIANLGNDNYQHLNARARVCVCIGFARRHPLIFMKVSFSNPYLKV